MKRTRSSNFSSSCTTDACAMPIDPSTLIDLTRIGNVSFGGRLIRRPRAKTAKAGVRMRW
jgi:hypothetical protein